MTSVRKGQWPGNLTRDEFRTRFRGSFFDPAFDPERDAIARLEEIAWSAYEQGNKAPRTQKAGPGFDDPDYELSIEWSETRLRLLKAEAQQKNPGSRSRVLVINASARNDGTCPGEVSKTFRLVGAVSEVLEAENVQVDVLDLSLLTSDFDKRIFPCKGCVSTAMPLCHWPCSCYPNHALGQTGDWMAEIYERWTAAHGVVICTPVYWYQSPSVLKLMIDRLVCADGGNPDPTSTAGKNPRKAKEIELRGWSYPKHLQGRVYGLVVHGDVAGIEGTRRSLSDWLDWMGLVDAGTQARLDRYIGYYKPYASSHEELDADSALFEEVRNVARAVFNAVGEMRAGRLSRPDRGLRSPRTK